MEQKVDCYAVIVFILSTMELLTFNNRLFCNGLEKYEGYASRPSSIYISVIHDNNMNYNKLFIYVCKYQFCKCNWICIYIPRTKWWDFGVSILGTVIITDGI